ncbi:hypothetical protein C8R46DRAFT_1040974 [Mycena filopes]|nr:hypothetical protein C8R46DRAFT_1040974 [Mycena filopes]
MSSPGYIPRPFNLNRFSESAITVYYTEVMRARQLAIANPVHRDLQFTLDLQIPRRNPGRRLQEFRRGFDEPPLKSIAVSLRLAEMLQAGVDGFSRVWTGDVLEYPGTRTHLVVKIIQPSRWLI